MNNFAPEIAALQKLYKGTGVTVTSVTLTQEEKKTQTVATGSTRFNLTTDVGIDDFAKALSLDASKTKIAAELLKNAAAFDRDDMAHVIAVYAMTEADGKDRMSRVVLSGRSRGEKIFAKGDKGDIHFTFLVSLAGVSEGCGSDETPHGCSLLRGRRRHHCRPLSAGLPRSW